MERLTIECRGEYVPKGLCSIDRLGRADECDICEEYCKKTEDCSKCAIQKCFERLAEYEDLEEQGKLLKLPCAVGDTVYTLNALPNGKTVIGETTADAFMCALCMLEGRFGKTIFLTAEEAEAALEMMKTKS